jgi:chorismate mutase
MQWIHRDKQSNGRKLMEKDIGTIRQELERLDEQLVGLLARRFSMTRAIGDWKERLGLPAVDEGRVRDFLQRWKDMAQSQGTSPDFIVGVAAKIHHLVATDHVERYPVRTGPDSQPRQAG